MKISVSVGGIGQGRRAEKIARLINDIAVPRLAAGSAKRSRQAPAQKRGKRRGVRRPKRTTIEQDNLKPTE